VDRLRDPENDQPKVAAAGPIANLLLATVSAIGLGITVAFGTRSAGTAEGLLVFLILVFQTAIMANVFLALFNLLPLPPLDGSWIVSRMLHGQARRNYEGLRRYGFLLVIGFLVLMHYTVVGDLVRRGFLLALGPFMAIARAISGFGA
jgi:Zn-dependent protease